MNHARRKMLEKARALIAEANDIIATAQSEEQDYYDNMPESLQYGDKGTRAEEVATALADVVQDLEDTLGRIEECEQ